MMPFLIVPHILICGFMTTSLAVNPGVRTDGPAGVASIVTPAEILTLSATAQPPAEPPTRTPAAVYRYWVLAPPIVAILLAIATRQVIPALAIAVLIGGYMLQAAPTEDIARQFAQTPDLLRGLRLAVEYYIIGALADTSHISVVLFTLIIGAAVGVMSANGGTQAMVRAVSHWASNRQRGQLLGWLAGMVVFFDDYANSMIVGPTMRPIYDKLRVSRQKLAYIVDSTAAPVASLALIGTWIGAEIGYIQSGLDALDGGGPAFLGTINAYQAFLYSIPYRFYAILALWMVFLVSATGRDFGPMKRAEQQPAPISVLSPADYGAPAVGGKWWYAGLPIAVLVGLTMGILFATGWQGRDSDAFDAMPTAQQLGEILRAADPYGSILYGAIAAVAVALILSRLTGVLNIARAVEAGLEGMSKMFPAVVVLVLAWALSQIMQHLELASVAAQFLEGVQFDVRLLPLAVFGASAVVSFSTGTSWGTMGILCPVTVTVAAELIAGLPAEQAAPLFYACVGSVLAGAVFGDHCSPISDTTVLSAVASGCSIESHVWTQLPYALATAAAAVACGNLLCSRYGFPWWGGLAAGALLLLVILLVIGRRPAASLFGPPTAAE